MHSSPAASTNIQFVPAPEDPCRPLSIPLFGWQPEVDHITVSGGGIDIYRIASVPSPVSQKKARPLVLIVNGNGFNLGDYDLLATHLASKGFLVGVAKRPIGVNPESFTLDAAQAILVHTEQVASTRIALVGHSVGGTVVVAAAVLNKTADIGLNIDAVVGIAPVADAADTPLTNEHAPAYLLIYGSQDQDVDGLSNVASDAFAAFDIAGTESSTTCALGGVCTATPNLDKTMVYIHGATHGGLINKLALCQVGNCTNDFSEFLSPDDQFCVTKAYTEAFLRWTLVGDQAYKSMVRDRYRPPSIQDMVTALPDELGNPAGSPVRLRLQSSPAVRSVINNFEGGQLNISPVSFGTFHALMEAGQYLGGAANVRHLTQALLVGWEEDDTWQLAAISVPKTKRDSSSYTHLALRLGQLDALPSPSAQNPFNTAQSVYIGLNDGTKTSWKKLKTVPANDRRPSGTPQSVMSTYEVLLSSFNNQADKTNVTAIYLAFPGSTQGTLMVDNIEWFRD